jgi:hypothetical protein
MMKIMIDAYECGGGNYDEDKGEGIEDNEDDADVGGGG